MRPEDLREIAITRAKSARHLIRNKDWQGASYMMGIALECALKASICKTLKIKVYPEKHKTDKEIPDFFMTHIFDRLFLLSGLSDVFSANGNPLAFNNWSDFTIQYQGNWVKMRYEPQRVSPFDKTMTEKLYNYLYGDKNSIIKVISRKRRW